MGFPCGWRATTGSRNSSCKGEGTMLVIDRIEGGIAVCETEDGAGNCPLPDFPPECGKGTAWSAWTAAGRSTGRKPSGGGSRTTAGQRDCSGANPGNNRNRTEKGMTCEGHTFLLYREKRERKPGESGYTAKSGRPDAVRHTARATILCKKQLGLGQHWHTAQGEAFSGVWDCFPGLRTGSDGAR